MAKVKRRASGEGTLTQTAEGTWRGAIRLPDGKRVWMRGATQAEVTRKMAELRASVDRGLPATSGRERLADYLAAWLEDSARPSVRPRTYDSYQSLAARHIVPRLGHVRLADLTPAHVQRLLTELQADGLSPASVHRVHAVLRRALMQALRWGLVARNVASLADLPKLERHEIDPLTPDQARRFLAAVEGHRLEALFAVALSMGLRRGEALGLRWQDVDLDNRTMMVRYQLQMHQRGEGVVPLSGKYGLVPTKSHRSRRSLVIPDTLAMKLRAHRARQARDRLVMGDEWQEHGLVFPTHRGTALDGRNVLRWYRQVLASAGLPPSRFHDLRHSCGSFLAAQGVPLVEIQAILGHAQIATTMIYVHSLPESMRRAAGLVDDMLWGEPKSESA